MPAIIGVPYILLEALTFWAVASWLGTGAALMWLLIFLFGGLVLAAYEMRAIAARLEKGKGTPGQVAGDIGLLAAGSVLVALPGFLTSIVGLLLILPPTRALARRGLAKKLRAFIEDLGVRSFEATNQYRTRVSYGSFGDASASDAPASRPIVIDETEIQEWSRNLKPEDFGKPGGGAK